MGSEEAVTDLVLIFADGFPWTVLLELHHEVPENGPIRTVDLQEGYGNGAKSAGSPLGLKRKLFTLIAMHGFNVSWPKQSDSQLQWIYKKKTKDKKKGPERDGMVPMAESKAVPFSDWRSRVVNKSKRRMIDSRLFFKPREISGLSKETDLSLQNMTFVSCKKQQRKHKTACVWNELRKMKWRQSIFLNEKYLF